MTKNTPIQFLQALATDTLKNPERWTALVWWYSTHRRATEATPRQICQDMEEAGYGKQNITRVTDTISKDRRLTRGKDGSFSVRITAKSDLDALYSKLLHTQPLPAPEEANPSRPETTKPAPSLNEPASALSSKQTKPALFIGSSAEGLKYARALEKQLEHHSEVTIWKDGVFGLGGGTLENLVNALPRFDFAALVLTPDDLAESRGRSQPSPRDNVIFELGLFMGRLGRHRTFIVYNKDLPIKLPSDLAGVTAATFGNRGDGNYHAQMSPPSTPIIDAIEKLGKFVPA